MALSSYLDIHAAIADAAPNLHSKSPDIIERVAVGLLPHPKNLVHLLLLTPLTSVLSALSRLRVHCMP